MDIWIFSGGEDEEMVFESDKKRIDVLGLNDLFDLIGGEGVGVNPDELVCVEGVLSDRQVQKEHPVVSKQRSDCIFCLQLLPTLFELFYFFVVPTFGDGARIHHNKLGVGLIPLRLNKSLESLVTKDDEIDLHIQQLFKCCEELSSRKRFAGPGSRPPSSDESGDEWRIGLMWVVSERYLEEKKNKTDICCFHDLCMLYVESDGLIKSDSRIKDISKKFNALCFRILGVGL